MISLESQITPFIESQFPSFYREEGPDFILFVETYYEWMQSSGQLINYSRKLPDFRDIDKTIDSFLTHFNQKYLLDIPYSTTANKRLLVKHIQDLYRTKGTERGVQLLFRLLYDIDAALYYPGENVFKLSNSKWKTPQYIEVSTNSTNVRFINTVIEGTTSGAIAYVERLVKKRVSGKFVDIFYLSAITGNFIYGERVVKSSDPIIEGAPQILGSLSALTITNGGQNYTRGDILNIISGSGEQGKVLVTDVNTETGRVTFEIVDGGFGYTANAQVIISQRNLGISNVVNANTSITSFERFETVQQPLATLVYTSTSNSAQWVGGAIVENYHVGNGAVSANALILSNAITNTSAGTLILLPLTGSMNVDSTFSLQGNSVTAVITSYVNSTATGNVMYTSNTSLGVFGVINSFVTYPGSYIYGMSSNTYANVATISSGTGATFSVGRLTNEETVSVSSDLLRANNTGNVSFMSILLDGSNSNVSSNGYGFVKYPAGTITNTTIQNLLRVSNKTIGEISVITGINPGENYNADPYVLVFEPEISSLGKRDVFLKINNLTGLFITDELIEMSSNSSGQQLTVSSFSGTHANGGVSSAPESGEYVWQSNGSSNTATGFVYQFNVVGGAGTIKLNNTTGTFVNTYGINTLTTNATATVSLANVVTLVTTTTGSVATSNTSQIQVKRLNLYNEFYSGYSLLGKSSGATATIIGVGEASTVALGENANITANVQVANTVVATVDILDSGFGYVDDEVVTMVGNNSNFVVTARTSLINQGVSEGYFDSEEGFLDSADKIHDGDYYQDYSYEVQSRIPLVKYGEILKTVMHTAGTKFFSKVIVDSAPDFGDSNIIETSARVYDLQVANANGSYIVGEKVSTTTSNGTFVSQEGIIVIANNQPYIESNTQISAPSFASNTSSATVRAITSNSTHSILYTTGIEGTIDTTDNIQAIIGRNLIINNIQQGNTVTGSFAVNETVYQSNTMGGVSTANGTVFTANNTTVQIRVVYGSWQPNTIVYGVTSNAYANTASITNASNTYVAVSSINTLRISNVSGLPVTSAILTGANSGAFANIKYISITLDT